MLSWPYWLMICILGCIFLVLAPVRIKPKEQLLIELIELLDYLHCVTDAFRFQESLKQTFECCVLESHWRVVFVATLQDSWRQRPEVTCWALRSSQCLEQADPGHPKDIARQVTQKLWLLCHEILNGFYTWTTYYKTHQHMISIHLHTSGWPHLK